MLIFFATFAPTQLSPLSLGCKPRPYHYQKHTNLKLHKQTKTQSLNNRDNKQTPPSNQNTTIRQQGWPLLTLSRLKPRPPPQHTLYQLTPISTIVNITLGTYWHMYVTNTKHHTLYYLFPCVSYFFKIGTWAHLYKKCYNILKDGELPHVY